ncbi:MAG TPA: DNA polymerase III subunit gamma/tau [Oculatellaceae cyanobacterium]
MTETRIETYIPLYRKYRPQTFADLVGQEAIAQTLGNAIRLNKVAHAYLFCGPRGTGKTSSARIFAKSLNCEQGPTVTPCLQCASCVGIAQGNALDVIEFDAASNNGVGDARELIENCQYSAMTGRFKVYIIDEVHMLTPQAFNALLKTLEEPPANVIFIFATTEAHKVLPTIISRCQRFDFNRITTENIVARLRYIAEQEQIRIQDDALMAIARHARGGLRDAVGLLDQVSVLSRAQQDKVIERQDVALFIGTLEEDLLLRLGAAIAERRSADLLNDLGELLNRGIEPVQLLKDLTMHFRNLLLVKAAGAQATPAQLGFAEDYYQKLSEQAKLFPEPEELPQIIGRLSFVERNVRNSNQPQLWLEVGLIELTYRYEINLVKDLAERVAKLEAHLASGAPVTPTLAASPAAPAASVAVPTSAKMPAATSTPPAAPMPATRPAPAPAPAAPPAPVGNASLQVSFTQICNTVPSLTTRALLQQQTFAISMENDVLVVGCSSEPTLSLLKKPDKFIHLQKAVDKFYGRSIRVELILEKKRDEVLAAAANGPAVPPPSPPQTAPTPAMATPPITPEQPIIPEAPADWLEDVPEPEEPEFDDDEEEDEEPSEAPVPVAAAVSAAPSEKVSSDEPDAEPEHALEAPAFVLDPTLSADPELAEAKKHALELLQGRILE